MALFTWYLSFNVGGEGVCGSAGAVEQSTCKWPLQHCSFKMSYRAAQGSQRECPGDRNY